MSTVQVGKDPYTNRLAEIAGLNVIFNEAVPKGEVWFVSSVDGSVTMKLKGIEK